jgi:signal transduction histidine kinase/ActR/RegA family two-component response regulator
LASIQLGAVSTYHRRPKAFIAATTLGILIIVSAFFAIDLWWVRARTLEKAGARASNLTYVLSEYLGQTFAAGDASLRQLVIHSRHAGGAKAPDAAWQRILAPAKAALTGIGSISVTDAEGIIRYSTQPAIVGESRRDQYLFKTLSTTTSDELIIDPPFLSRVQPPHFLVPFGRRLTSGDGTFEGIVVATLIPDQHRSFFRTVDVGHEGIVWVFHEDGAILVREPSESNPIGESAKGNPIYEAARQRAARGQLAGPVRSGGQSFLSSYLPLGKPPLIVAVSLNENEVLRDWRHEVQVSSLGLAVLSLTLALTVLVLFRQIDAKASAEQALANVQQLEAIKLRDTNERLEAALAAEQRARRETEAASYVKDEFLMTVSHELRTPLNAIYGWARLLATGRVGDEQRGRALSTIERNARAQARLIDDLLDVSRVISGKLRLDVRQLNPVDVLNLAVDAMRPAIEAKSIRLETSVDPDLGTITADPQRLQQIVWNLLSNATKFTPEGGRIQLRMSRQNSHVEIVVTDSGIGISPEFLPYVFERFRQQDAGTRRRYGGLGLGLAIVRHLVELHGGSVRAESTGEGDGSTFRVLLPFQAARQLTETDERLRAAAKLATDARLDGLRVLVVDDEPEARELFTSILEAAGATVVTAASAQDAMTILNDDFQDVLLSDIEMPNQDGYQLVTEALALARRHGTRLNAVAVTAYARTEDKVRALEAGYHWHLAKPVEPSELVSVIASLVHQPHGESRLH